MFPDAVIVVSIIGESYGRGWWSQRSRRPGKIPRVKDQEARGPEREGNSVSVGRSLVKVAWASLEPADPDLWL